MGNKDFLGVNLQKPVLELNHSKLESSGESLYRKICPVCKEGVLLVYRDQESFKLVDLDMCILCGQRVKYLDIADMRSKEGL